MNINANPIPSDPTSLQVNWNEAPDEVYDTVAIDEYQTSQLPAKGPFPPPEQSQGRPDGLPALKGTTEFHNLKPGTSYVFVIYGTRGTDSGPVTTQLTVSSPVSTPAATQPPPTDPGLSPPTCKAFPQPKDLNNSNRILVTWTSSTSYDIFAVTCNYTANPPMGSRVEINSGGTNGSYTFLDLQPGNEYAFSAQGGQDQVGGLLAGTLGHRWSAYGPLFRVQAAPNSSYLREFLKNSSVSGANGIRPLVPKLASIDLRSLMGI